MESWTDLCLSAPPPPTRYATQSCKCDFANKSGKNIDKATTMGFLQQSRLVAKLILNVRYKTFTLVLKRRWKLTTKPPTQKQKSSAAELLFMLALKRWISKCYKCFSSLSSYYSPMGYSDTGQSDTAYWLSQPIFFLFQLWLRSLQPWLIELKWLTMSAISYSPIYLYLVMIIFEKEKNKPKIQKELDLHGLLS